MGKASNNSLLIDDPTVDDHHAEIINQQDQLSLKKRSARGILKVNGMDVIDSCTIKANDSILIGSVELQLVDSQSLGTTSVSQQPWSLYSSASWLEKQHFVINKKTVIGRDPACDICLGLDYLSRKHICLEPVNGKLIIEDLNSSNGTFVNGERIQKAELKPGDKIKIDVLTFEVRGPSDQSVSDPHKTIIRSIPASSALANKTATPNQAIKKSESGSSVQAQSVQNRTTPVKENVNIKDKAGTRKRLAAEGKQPWISGDNQLKPKPEKKKSNRGIIIVITVLIIIAAGALYAIKL
jgi:pSer/pThr/pTyr-binding forkhead associated (FHA) protein